MKEVTNKLVLVLMVVMIIITGSTYALLNKKNTLKPLTFEPRVAERVATLTTGLADASESITSYLVDGYEIDTIITPNNTSVIIIVFKKYRDNNSL